MTSRPKKRHLFKKIWQFLWYEESVASYATLILLAFVLIKFILYPGLGLITGTSLPVVAVVSGSMEHPLEYDAWWEIHRSIYEKFDINKTQFQEFAFENGFNRGDIIILTGAQASEVKVGDVIVYQSAKTYPIIHRVIENDPWQAKFQTKGDNNLGQIVAPDLNEQNVPYKTLIGRAVLRIPYLGYVKIGFVEGLAKIGIRIE